MEEFSWTQEQMLEVGLKEPDEHFLELWEYLLKK